MELIPVFAFIVLVASIVTFIFSLAAYVLYKIREKRGRYAAEAHPKAFQAELVTPNYYYLSNHIENEKLYSQSDSTNLSDHLEDKSKELKDTDKNNGNDLVWR